MKRRPVRSLAWTAALALCVLTPATTAPAETSGRVPVVEELARILEEQPPLRAALEAGIKNADLEGLSDLESFLAYLDDLATYVPVEREVGSRALKLYYVVNQAPDDRLSRDETFSAWLHRFVDAWGAFLDTPASAAHLDSFIASPGYRAEDYFEGPSGWLTFNQFFAREIRPGKRPVAEPHDDAVVVSPADSVFAGQWRIDADSRVTVKGIEWTVSELLDGSPHEAAFENGLFTHGFLGVGDYHRFHVPVGGVVREVRNIHGRVYMDVVRQPDGTLRGVDGETYQIDQERGLVVIDSPAVGLVAILPVGMSFVSSVTLTPEVGAHLRKGEEFGFFQFGGPDIVMLFQDRGLVIEAEVGEKVLQGQRIGALR